MRPPGDLAEAFGDDGAYVPAAAVPRPIHNGLAYGGKLIGGRLGGKLPAPPARRGQARPSGRRESGAPGRAERPGSARRARLGRHRTGLPEARGKPASHPICAPAPFCAIVPWARLRPDMEPTAAIFSAVPFGGTSSAGWRSEDPARMDDAWRAPGKAQEKTRPPSGSTRIAFPLRR
jgi:hypothetical protein